MGYLETTFATLLATLILTRLGLCLKAVPALTIAMSTLVTSPPVLL